MPNDRDIEAPISLMGLFDDPSEPAEVWENTSEEQIVHVVGNDLRVRQYCFHEKNANRVWPGTFNLAEYYLSPDQPGLLSDLLSSPVLELGSATGLLALRFSQAGVDISTSDYDDSSSGEESIQANILFNYGLNHQKPVPEHIPHTWGDGWPETRVFKTVIASDILLYTAVYEQLTLTITQMFHAGTTTFVMSWDRRMDESKAFFVLMTEAGFTMTPQPKCIFVFTRS